MAFIINCSLCKLSLYNEKKSCIDFLENLRFNAQSDPALLARLRFLEEREQAEKGKAVKWNNSSDDQRKRYLIF